MEAELAGFFFQRRDQTFIEADGGAAFPADDVVMVMAGLLRKIKGLALENESLNQAGLPEGFQNSVDGGPVADLRSHLGMNLFRGEGEEAFSSTWRTARRPGVDFRPACRSGLLAWAWE